MAYKITILILASFLSATALIRCDAQENKPQPQDTARKAIPMNLTSSDTSGQLMNEDEFWKLIDKSRTNVNNDYQKQVISLTAILAKLDANAIEKFDNTFTALLAVSYDSKLWGAAYVINGGCSEDCFDYFRHYLIGHGKNKFYQTLNDPESCVGWIKSEEQDNWEGLQYSASEAYKHKTGAELPKSYNPKLKLKGAPINEDSVFTQYPKLAKKFKGGK